MKLVGYCMVTLGFLAGALACVTDEKLVSWGWLTASTVVAVMGVTLVRMATRQAAREQGKVTTGMRALHASLHRIVERARMLDDQKSSIDPHDARTRIDELFPEDLAIFVDSRESIAHVHGLQAYAEVMNHFAAGERYLNRVWSASADGYVDEVCEYLGKTVEEFADALRELERLEQPAA